MKNAALLPWRIAAPLLLRLATAMLPVYGAEEAQPIGAPCSVAFECQNPELVHCIDGVCACRYGHHSPYLCKEAPVTHMPPKEEENWWSADRECQTDHQCHRGYCWHGTCSCKDGFVKERSSSGSWSCVHLGVSHLLSGEQQQQHSNTAVSNCARTWVPGTPRNSHRGWLGNIFDGFAGRRRMKKATAKTAREGGPEIAIERGTSSFGFGILAVIPVTVVVLCLFACCVQVALRKQQQMPSNAAEGAQLELARDGVMSATNIYRQRRYFPHYVEGPQTETEQQTLAVPTASTGMKPIEESAPGFEEPGSSSNNQSPQAGR